ncbi:hypothetical protein C8R44DRAFT_909149 [Mycena epipterygia]|nr:hypothetical protein C8R44DRAFT_909149 [Mycena epipterygia]
MCTLVEIGAVHGPHPLDTGYTSTPGYVWARRWTRFTKREEERAEENGGRIECYDTASARASAPMADLEADARCGTVPLPTSTSRYGRCLFCIVRIPAHVYAAGPPNLPLSRSARGHPLQHAVPPTVWHPGERMRPLRAVRVHSFASACASSSAPVLQSCHAMLPTANEVRDADTRGKTQRRARPARRANLVRVPRSTSRIPVCTSSSSSSSPSPNRPSSLPPPLSARTRPVHAQLKHPRHLHPRPHPLFPLASRKEGEMHHELRVGTSVPMVGTASTEGTGFESRGRARMWTQRGRIGDEETSRQSAHTSRASRPAIPIHHAAIIPIQLPPSSTASLRVFASPPPHKTLPILRRVLKGGNPSCSSWAACMRHGSIRDGCSTTNSARAEVGPSALVVDASSSKEPAEVGQIPPESRYGLLCARADPRRVGDPRWHAFEEGKDTDTAGDESIGRHRRRTPSLSAHRGPISIHQPELHPPSFLHTFSPRHFPEPTASSVVARMHVFSLALEQGGCIVLVVVARSTTNAGAGASMDLARAGAHQEELLRLTGWTLSELFRAGRGACGRVRGVEAQEEVLLVMLGRVKRVRRRGPGREEGSSSRGGETRTRGGEWAEVEASVARLVGRVKRARRGTEEESRGRGGEKGKDKDAWGVDGGKEWSSGRVPTQFAPTSSTSTPKSPRADGRPHLTHSGTVLVHCVRVGDYVCGVASRVLGGYVSGLVVHARHAPVRGGRSDTVVMRQWMQEMRVHGGGEGGAWVEIVNTPAKNWGVRALIMDSDLATCPWKGYVGAKRADGVRRVGRM